MRRRVRNVVLRTRQRLLCDLSLETMISSIKAFRRASASPR